MPVVVAIGTDESFVLPFTFSKAATGVDAAMLIAFVPNCEQSISSLVG